MTKARNNASTSADADKSINIEQAAAAPLPERAPPQQIAVGVTPIEDLRRLRVVDAETGETIAKVQAADADAKSVTRLDVVDGNLVREGDAYRTITEDRAIRIEWTDAEDNGF